MKAYDTRSFYEAYSAYHGAVRAYATPSDVSPVRILEVGGGAHPSIKERDHVEYTIIDPDQKELDKVGHDIKKVHGTVQELKTDQRFDLIISKMVLEHIKDPDTFHQSIKKLLRPDGVAIHFFACRHSLPAVVNRFVPERIGDRILKLLRNRDLGDSPKYRAYYRQTLGHTDAQIHYFRSCGYKVERYHSFVGHKYLQHIPILRSIERLYTVLLCRGRMKRLATVAMVVLKVKS